MQDKCLLIFENNGFLIYTLELRHYIFWTNMHAWRNILYIYGLWLRDDHVFTCNKSYSPMANPDSMSNLCSRSPNKFCLQTVCIIAFSNILLLHGLHCPFLLQYPLLHRQDPAEHTSLLSQASGIIYNV